MLGDSLAFSQMKDASSLSSSPLDISPLFFWVFCPFSFDASHSSSSSSLDDFPPFLGVLPFPFDAFHCIPSRSSLLYSVK